MTGDAAREPEAGGRGRGRRPLWAVVLALLLASAALWGSSRLTWLADYRDTGVRGVLLHTEPGAQQAGALVPLAVLALAAVAGLVAAGRWARRALAVLIGAAGAAACALAAAGLDLGGGQPDYPLGAILAGRGLAAAAGLLLLAAAVLVLRHAARMPGMGARYDSPAAASRRDPDTELWDALSQGEDPTARR